jgi:phosphoglycolate phosphatase
MANLYARTESVVEQTGIAPRDAKRIVADAWFVPDPVALARPVGDAARVFAGLRERGIRVGVVTSDDRVPTLASLDALGLAPHLDVLVCADDGLPNKPAPDMLLHACRTLNISPQHTLVVGDAVADMQAGRAAGAGLCVGVLSGLSSREILAPYADVIIDTLDALTVEHR